MSRHELTDLGQKPNGIGELNTLPEDHLHLPGLPEQFASLTDAHLVVEGKHLPVHTGVLALVSPVFTDLFMTAAEDRAAATSANKVDSLCVPLTGHTMRDTCAALKFLYQRSMHVLDLTEAPSKQLWKSVADARPIVKFAHKFYMKGILKECDHCLSEKAQEAGEDGVNMFSNNKAVIAWAALAEECDLSNLLATAEAHMVKTLDPTFWQSESFAVHKLSQTCLLRLLQGAQYHAISSARIHTTQQQTSTAAKSLPERCFTGAHNGWCSRCHPPRCSFPAGEHASVPHMLTWQKKYPEEDL